MPPLDYLTNGREACVFYTSSPSQMVHKSQAPPAQQTLKKGVWPVFKQLQVLLGTVNLL